MDHRLAYEAELLSTFARMGRRAPELSDTDRDHEFLAQRIFFAALEAFKGEVCEAASLSGLRKDALSELLIGLADATPDVTAWDEAISDARRGY